MFTGIVEEIGTVRRLTETPSGKRAVIGCRRVLGRLAVDDSVAVAGTCLTVVARDERSFTCDIVPETLARTSLGALRAGSRVNLERSLTPRSAMGGHIVQGHVDATTRLLSRADEGDGARLRFALPRPLARYVVMKGFIALDGVSLTVARLGRTSFEVALIPHTAAHTTLGALGSGDAVNVEVDVLAKYVERIIGASRRA